MPAHEMRVVVIGESLVDIISDPRQPEEIQVHPGSESPSMWRWGDALGLHTTW